jgi:hypothetical protein
VEDPNACIYEGFHLFFIEPLLGTLLEELAAAVAQDGTGESIEQVCCIENNVIEGLC